MERQPRRRVPWFAALVAVVVSAVVGFCGVVAWAVAPAFGSPVTQPPPEEVMAPDVTVRVSEAYLAGVVAEFVPGAGETVAVDVRPGNELAVITVLQFLGVHVDVVVTAEIVVEAGEVALAIKSAEAEGRDVLDLLGEDELLLSEAMADRVQRTLAAPLGEGLSLVRITTTADELEVVARREAQDAP